MTFKVGDRVRVVTERWHTGKTGEVITVDLGAYAGLSYEVALKNYSISFREDDLVLLGADEVGESETGGNR